MKCPYCDNEMKVGTINARGGSGMFWLPEGEKLKTFEIVTAASISKHNGVNLLNSDFSGPARRDATICLECQKVLIDLNK